MLDDLFMTILDMTRVGSIVILVVLLARLLLKRAPKIFSYALWAVVLFRLLCPVSLVETTVSLVPEIAPVADTYSLKDEPISVLEAGNAAYQAVGDALNGGLGVQHIRTTQIEPDGTYRVVSTDWYSVWILFGQYVWLVGAVWMVLRSGLSYGKLRRRIAVAIGLNDNIYLVDDLESPFVVGLIRPKIYLPSNLSQREYDYIILHERHHIRRGDHIIKALAFLALCLHWFNPLVWLAFHLASKDMEMSCDEAVVRKMGEGIRADYSASLLTLATGRRIIAGTPLAFGEGDPKGRIRNLAKWKKPAIWVLVLAIILCVVIGVCLLTDRVSADGNAGTTWYYGTVIESGSRPVSEGDTQERGYFVLESEDGQEILFWIAEGADPPENVEGSPCMIRSLVEPETGLLTMVSMQIMKPGYQQSLDEAINEAILHHNFNPRHEGMFSVASFKQLDMKEGKDTVTVYGLAFHQVFRLEGDLLVEEGGSHIPSVLTFANTSDGFILTEYWQPRDGGYYSDDIRAKFKGRPWPDTQKYIAEQMLNNYRQAMDYYAVGTDVLINTVLDSIQAKSRFTLLENLLASDDADVQILLQYYMDTLTYCFNEFLEGGQTDARGDVMAAVCRKIGAVVGEELTSVGIGESGQAWFEAFGTNAEELLRQFAPETIQAQYPVSRLYLRLTEQILDVPITGSASANDFEIRLYSEKESYWTGEEVVLWATLEYQGEADTVTIWHGLPYITFAITDGADFNTGGMVRQILTSTKLRRGEVYRFEYAKSGGYDPAGPDGAFWENFYQEEALHLPPGTYTVTVSGAFSISREQRPGEQGPSCQLQITVTE